MKTLIPFLVIASFVTPTQAAAPAKKSNDPKTGRQTLRIPTANRHKPGSQYGIKKNPLRGVNRSEGVMEELGGSAKTEAAVKKALDWLTKKQKDDGHWEETSSKVAHTGLAILCYMSYGVKPTDKTPYGEALSKGLKWLKGQVPESGNMRDGGKMYDQAIGTLALGEAYGITGNQELSLPVDRATKLLVKAQNSQNGGWRYTPNSTDNDLSVSGWVIMALRSAEMAGKRLSDDTVNKTKRYLDTVSAGKHKGKYGYKSPAPKYCMTSVGMYCQQLLTVRRAVIDERQNESAAYLNLHLPDKKQKNYYYWYYGTLCLNLHGGEVWQKWNEKMKPIFLEKQQADGSWKAEGSRAKKEGTHVTTCWATLSLSVYYRYLPMLNGYRRMGLGRKPLARVNPEGVKRINLPQIGVRTLEEDPTLGPFALPAEPVKPFNRKDLDGWKQKGPTAKSHLTVGTAKLDPGNPRGFIVTKGGHELINAKGGGFDFYTEAVFGDAVFEVEVMVPKGSNSGIYLMGEYEVQILDSYGRKKLGGGDMGAIYGAAPPRVNACKKPGEWQKYEIHFRAPRFEGNKKTANARLLKVILNGQLLHENVEMKKATPGGVDGKEKAVGPLMFQGTHGPVAYRNIVIKPLK